MSLPKSIRVLGALALCLAVLVLGSCGSREKKGDQAPTPSPTAPDIKTPKPGLDLGLSVSPGGSGDASLITLRLFSGSLRQLELDNAAKKEGPRTVVEPLRVSIPRESWANVDFWILDQESSFPKDARKKLAGVVLVDAPGSDPVSLGPKVALTAVYQVPSANLPPPDTLIQAEMKAAMEIIRSGAVPVPRPPDSEKGLLLRKAEIQLKLKSWREAEATAEGIIGRFPGEPSGYWLKGLALEGEGLDTEALKMVNTALEKAVAKEDAREHEPPLPIIIKIRELEEKISAPGKK